MLNAAALLYTFVVLGPGGQAVARAVVSGRSAACPALEVAGAPAPMSVRFAGGPGWEITVCEAALPAGAKASIAGKPLPARSSAPRTVVAMGDTGCRIRAAEGGTVVQDCNGGGWPLQALARAAALRKPDLFIHLGDYVYRKAPCPAGDARCAGSPWGPSWPTLEADFFAAAKPLLEAAPLVVPRGNHESCAPERGRVAIGGIGFFALFDPRPAAEVIDAARLPAFLEWLAASAGGDDEEEEDEQPPPAPCAESTPAYRVPLDGATDLWVVDSNQPGDSAASLRHRPELVEPFARSFRDLQAASARDGRRAWLLTHRPLYALYPGKRGSDGRGPPSELNATLQAAFERAGRPPAVDLALAGHVHLFQLIDFADGQRPPGFTVGSGGTRLDDFSPFPDVVDPARRLYAIAGDAEQRKKVSGLTASAFGFLAITRGEAGWRSAEFVGTDGSARLTCELRERRAACKRAGE